MLYSFSEKRAGYNEGFLWGFLDENGKAITPAHFGLVWDFKEGLARAAYRDGIGFINPNGELVLEPRWKDARDFSEGLARVQL